MLLHLPGVFLRFLCSWENIRLGWNEVAVNDAKGEIETCSQCTALLRTVFYERRSLKRQGWTESGKKFTFHRKGASSQILWRNFKRSYFSQDAVAIVAFPSIFESSKNKNKFGNLMINEGEIVSCTNHSLGDVFCDFTLKNISSRNYSCPRIFTICISLKA